ncbi:MAG: phosphoribosylformylglycinamidine cyclo-ligase [Terrimicrobiaceae bacterium]|nr:phosphoribosylformylglycinamidine cyclo-ligase [Terrimicrobiaceae bacterium]
MPRKLKAYAEAGVDVDLGNRVKRGIQDLAASTHGPEVLGKIGGFGGLFRPNFKGLRDPVLVSSVDGVGTKLKIAFATGRHDTIGQDLVNHCINDIAVIGARPLFFLDYIAGEKLDPVVFRQILKGFATACRAGGCALIGGETAQLPGMYHPGEYDLAGTIVGVVDRPKLLDGSKIRMGDILIGLRGNGLHTNGYSLARKVLLQKLRLPLNKPARGMKSTLAAELLRVHPNYQPLMASLPAGMLHGAAHITGGGLLDNLPRVLPDGCRALINSRAWRVPMLFELIQHGGQVPQKEMYQVFNMGIGMVLIVPSALAGKAARLTKGLVIGSVVKGAKDVVIE